MDTLKKKTQRHIHDNIKLKTFSELLRINESLNLVLK